MRWLAHDPPAEDLAVDRRAGARRRARRRVAARAPVGDRRRTIVGTHRRDVPCAGGGGRARRAGGARRYLRSFRSRRRPRPSASICRVCCGSATPATPRRALKAMNLVLQAGGFGAGRAGSGGCRAPAGAGAAVHDLVSPGAHRSKAARPSRCSWRRAPGAQPGGATIALDRRAADTPATDLV